MCFIHCLKKLIFNDIQENFSEEPEKDNDYNFSVANLFNSMKNKLSSCFCKLTEKIFLIRIMIFATFYSFLFILIKSIEKADSTFKFKNYNIEQLDYIDDDFKDLNISQLINKKNIVIKRNLSVKLSLEHSNFVHLEINNQKKNRWKVTNEILNPHYFDTLKEDYNKKNINFEVEYYKYRKNFFFHLYRETEKQKNIFYSFTTRKNFLFSSSYINFESILSSDDIYGFGERIHNFKLNQGIYTIWPANQKSEYDDGFGGNNLYGHQPIALHKTKFDDLWLGLVFLNSNEQDVQIYKNEKKETVISHKTIGGIIDYYIIVNNSPENVIRDIKYLIGSPAIPPYWALGFHQGGDMFNDINELKKVYEIYKNKEIPLDAIWLNENLLYKYNNDDLTYKNFANFIREKMHSKDHIKLIATRNCDISYKDKEFSKYLKIGNEYNIFVRSGYTENNLVSHYENGESIIPDFLDPEIDKLWNEILFDIYNTKANFDGFCLQNEPIASKDLNTCQGEILNKRYSCNLFRDFQISYLPGFKNNISILSNGALNFNARTFNNMIFNNKPLINIYQSFHTFNFIKSLKKRPFVMSQSNSFGSGKYSFHWFGENESTNSNLNYSISSIFTFNIFGMPFTGADICGYYGKGNPNLCLRWYNLGAFYPFMRSNFNFKEGEEKYPWSFGPDAESIIVKDIKMRYSLIKYFYSQLFLVSLNEKGSFFKPVMFEFPNDKNSYNNIEDKIMIGEALLMCAFFNNTEEDKKFIFPNANFNKYPTGENIINYNEGEINNKEVKLSGKIDELHIFLRGGFIIPMQDTFNKYVKNTFYLRQKKLNLIINPDHMGYSRGTIIFDNDEIDTIEQNKYIRVELEFKDKSLKVNCISNNTKYIYRDDILKSIEIWRINEIFKDDNINKENIDIKIKVKDKSAKINGNLDKKNNKIKIIFENSISLFDIYEIDIID